MQSVPGVNFHNHKLQMNGDTVTPTVTLTCLQGGDVDILADTAASACVRVG